MPSFTKISIRHQVPLTYIFYFTMLGIMGLSITSPATPAIARHFGLQADSAWTILTFFAVPGAISAITAGVLADLYGRKVILAPALLIFAMGAVGCALSESYSSFLLWRAVQGLGGGPLGVLNITLIADVYQPHERPRIMGLAAMALGLATAFFPLLGGIVTEWDWRFTFWACLVAVPVFFGFVKIPLPKVERPSSLADYGRVCKEMLASKAALVLFGISFITFFAFYGPTVTYIPIFADALFNASPSAIGLMFVAGAVGSIIISGMAGRLTLRYSMRALMVGTCAFFTLAAITMFFVGSLWWLLVPLTLSNLGQGLAMPVMNARISLLSQGQGQGVAMAMNGLMFRMSQAVSPALCGLAWGLAGPLGPYGLALIGCLLAFPLVFYAFGPKLKLAEYAIKK